MCFDNVYFKFMPRAILKLLSIARVLFSCAFVGAVYGGLASCAALSATYFYMARNVPARIPTPAFISEFLQISIYGFLCGMPGGLLMGIIAAIIGGRFGWFYGGAIAGLAYSAFISTYEQGTCIHASETELFGIFVFMTACGLFVGRAAAYDESSLPLARWLRRRLQTSPLENCAAWKRTLFGVASPLVIYALILTCITWPSFWQNRAYLSRLGFVTTWRQSYYSATKSNFNRRSSCQSNLKQLMLAIKLYEQDYDERLPLVASGEKYFGWADAISLYARSTQNFQCPSEFVPSGNNPRRREYSDYWFNTNLSGISESAVNQSALTISLGEGNDGVDVNDARYNRSTLPPTWLKNSASPAQRHVTFRGGANYAFLDSHVKWLLPPVVSSKPSQTLPSFVPQ